MGLSGVVILRMSPMGKIDGWWLGTGRKDGDIGGEVTWTRASEDPEKDFQLRSYPVEA